MNNGTRPENEKLVKLSNVFTRLNMILALKNISSDSYYWMVT